MLTDGSGLVNYIQSSAIYLCPTLAQADTGVTVTSSKGSPMDPAELAQVLHDLTSGYNFRLYGFPYADAAHGVTFNTVEYAGTNPPSRVTSWHIVIGPPANL